MKKIFSFLLMLMLVATSAFAQNTRVYCKMAQDWWKADGAAVGVHYWGGTSATQWPGIRMTAVEGETDLWTAEIPSNSTGLIFVRVNGSGAISDWGAQTANLTLPTDGKNLYTITSTSATWGGNPGVTGEWSVYEAAGENPEQPETPEIPQDTTTTEPADDITVKVLRPAAWTNDLSVWHWVGDGNGAMATMTAEGEGVYSYTFANTESVNVIFINGATWNGDANQTVDIKNITASTCYTLTTGTGKATATEADCETLGEGGEQGGEEPEPVVLPVISLRGTLTDWTAGATMTAAADKLTCSHTLTLAAGSYEFKVVKGETWLGNNGTMTRENCTGWVFDANEGNCTLTADAAGDYVFTFEYATNKVLVTYPEIQQGNEDPETPSDVESYTIKFKDSGNNSDNSTKRTKLADIVVEGADYIASVDAASDIYQARTGLGIKFGASSKAGSLTMTLAEPAEFDSIAFTAAMYGATEGADGFTVNSTTIPLYAGDKVLERNVIQPTGVVSQLAIAQVKANNGRFYMTEITFYPKANTGEQGGDTVPQDTTPAIELPFDYAIALANDTVALEANPSAENEYMALCVEMEANAQVKLMNKQGHVWSVGLEEGVEVATATEEAIVITEAGKYDFYLKLEYGNDRFWIANAACAQGEDTIPQDTTIVTPVPVFAMQYGIEGAEAWATLTFAQLGETTAWETDTVVLPTEQFADYKLWVGNPNWLEGKSETVAISTLAGAEAGAKGVYRIYDDSQDMNWYIHFIKAVQGGNDTIPQDTTIVTPPTGDGYYVAGNGVAGNPWCNSQNWAPAAAENELHNGAITFTNVPAGVYQFKVTNGTWDMSWGYADLTDQTGCEDGGGNNVKFVTSVAQDITIRFNAETQKITLEAQIGGTVEITTYTIVGEAAIVGAEWNPADASNDMTLANGVYTLVKEGVEIAEAKDYMYKVVGNHSYDVYQYPAGMENAYLTIAEAGKYNITYTFAPATETLNATAVKVEEPVEGLESATIVVYRNGMIINENGAMVYVYSVNGALVTMSNENINLNGYANGVYIIRTANNYFKVVR